MRTKAYLWKANAQVYGLGEGRKNLPNTYHYGDFGRIPKQFGNQVALRTKLVLQENFLSQRVHVNPSLKASLEEPILLLQGIIKESRHICQNRILRIEEFCIV